ncbi:hypothetical protein PESHB5_01850 [Pediococcus parvulus]
MALIESYLKKENATEYASKHEVLNLLTKCVGQINLENTGSLEKEIAESFPIDGDKNVLLSIKGSKEVIDCFERVSLIKLYVYRI